MSKGNYETNDLGRKYCNMLNIGIRGKICSKGDLFKLIKRDCLSRGFNERGSNQKKKKKKKKGRSLTELNKRESK